MKKTVLRTTFIGLALSLSLLVAGCSSTPRGLNHVPAGPALVVDASQSAEEQAFAEAGGRLAEGTETVVPVTPIGMAQVRVTGTYMNALGENCRRIEAKNQNATLSCGVCLGRDGVWRYVALHP